MNSYGVLRKAFTIIELLIVIAILGLLFQLILPAVQSSRESARQLTCTNNLRQIGIAFQLHHDAHEHYPTGGWMPMWVGDPLRGFGRDQPGGWIYGVLPYLESNSIRNLPDDGNADQITQQQLQGAAGMMQLPIPVMQCSSRRLPRAYPYWLGDPWNPHNANRTESVARCDFAANGGDVFNEAFPFFDSNSSYPAAVRSYSEFAKAVHWIPSEENGICFFRSEIATHHITDGLSNTYLVGEKYLNGQHYQDGIDPGDNHSMYQGYDRDIIRWAGTDHAPLSDSVLKDISTNFGSAHPSSFQVAYCDGSVQRVAYNIDPEVHAVAANRNNSGR